MSENNNDLINDSVNALQVCNKTLTTISETCCTPDRNPNMKEAQISITDIINTTREIYHHTQNAQKCIEGIGNFGSKIGYLYATCCTATREPLYQIIFKNLMTVHNNMSKILGHSH